VLDPATAEDRSARSRLKLVLVLGSLIALGPLTIDMYLPALPSIPATSRRPRPRSS
jgi:DHA1 family bicyclomycin/chloramphenicol resistance-like MFS transporter